MHTVYKENSPTYIYKMSAVIFNHLAVIFGSYATARGATVTSC